MTQQETALNLPQMVRDRDYRRFLVIQLASRAKRPILYALTAFADEMARIPAHVSEPLAGFMRFAWWRESLQEMQAGKPPRGGHPLLTELAPFLMEHPESFALLDALITSGQLSFETPDDAGIQSSREAALDGLWALALEERDNHIFKSLKSLPLGQPIGPLKILRLIFKSLQA